MRVGGWTRSPDSGLNFQRLLGPFSLIEKEHGNISYKELSSVDWKQLCQIDLLIVQDPIDKADLAAMEMAKDFGCKVIADYGDDYLNIPPHNPVYTQLGGPSGALERVKKALNLSDMVWAASSKIAELLRAHCPSTSKVHTILNAVDERVFGPRPVPPSGNKSVLWRGGSSHLCDFTEEVEEALVSLSESNPEWQWHFVGYGPFRIFDRMKNISYYPLCDLTHYHRKINSINASVCIVPLKDDPFNRAKTFQGWAEGSWSGANVLAPKLPLWKDLPGIFTYEPGEFKGMLQGLMKHPSRGAWEEAVTALDAHHRLAQRNESRWHLLKSCMYGY